MRWTVGAVLVAGCGATVEPQDPVRDGPTVVMETVEGEVTIGLFASQAPQTTANFLAYVEEGFYDGRDGVGPTVFHRIVPDFVVQGGGFLADGTRKPTRAPIVNESDNGLRNRRGTLAMARTGQLDSATSQWFVNLVDNPFLDARRGRDGYAVFGEVTAGMEVFEAIAAAPATGELALEPIVIERMVVVP
jgi:cyclophilin family peptidyl-prolyl cis-trans isomerase